MKRTSQVGWLSKKTLKKKKKSSSSDDDLAQIDIENATPSIETPDISGSREGRNLSFCYLIIRV